MPDAADARRLLNDRVRAIVLVTPNNPTGAVYPPKTIAAFWDLCAERSIPVILDETYRDFMPADAPPHACLADPNWVKTVIQLYSFSKAYCIPGHRAGAIVADASTLAEIAKIMDTLQICAPRIPQLVLPWAIETLRDWRESNREEIARRAAAFTRAIDALDGWSIGSIGAYFAYVAHPFRNRTDTEICEWLAAKRGVICLPGSYFGPSQNGFLRVAFANVDVSGIEQIPARLAAGASNGPKRASARDR